MKEVMEPDRTIEIVQKLAAEVDPYTGERLTSGSPYQQADTVRVGHKRLDPTRKTVCKVDFWGPELWGGGDPALTLAFKKLIVAHELGHALYRVATTVPDGHVVTKHCIMDGLFNPYALASRVHYARWLSRRGRFNESLSFWNDLLPLGDTAVTDSLETKEEIAQCYIGLKQPEKAKSILQEISNQSDSAFGLLKMFDRRSAAGAPVVSNEMNAATWNDLK